MDIYKYFYKNKQFILIKDGKVLEKKIIDEEDLVLDYIAELMEQGKIKTNNVEIKRIFNCNML